MRSFAVLSAVFLIASLWLYKPEAATDLDSLIPVETLWVEEKDGKIVICGKDVRGEGVDWNSAMEDLEATAEGVVFLETVDRVIVEMSAEGCMRDVRRDRRFRPAVRLYYLQGTASEKLDGFTAAHESAATIGNGKEVPLIVEEEGRYRLA